MSMNKRYELIYEDDDYCIVNKPAGLLTIAHRFNPDAAFLVQLIKKEIEKPYVVHRLDRDTSGLLCIAKNEEAHKSLSAQFQERSVEKIYDALIHGKLQENSIVINEPIRESPFKKGKYEVHPTGKNATTEFTTEESFKNYSRVKCKLITGRTHQIRVHLKENGNPIVADNLYSTSGEFLLSEIKGRRKYRTAKYEEERPLIKRQMLHSSSLQFNHPKSGEKVTYTSEPPKDFKALLYQLRKLNSIS